MRLAIRHVTRYAYDTPVLFALQRVRLQVPSDTRQYTNDWTLEVDGAVRELNYSDAFGNETVLVRAEDGAEEVVLTASGTVEVQDTAGLIGTLPGAMPLFVYRNPTPLTMPGKTIEAVVQTVSSVDPVDRLHRLMDAVTDAMRYESGYTDAYTSAEDALKSGVGVCQDFAHIYCAAARRFEVPTRYVSGYLMMDDREEQTATHAWAEAWTEELGWIGFDCANRMCPDDRYVRIATGRDYHDASPVSGVRIGTAEETLDVQINVKNRSEGSQQQSINGGSMQQQQSGKS